MEQTADGNMLWAMTTAWRDLSSICLQNAAELERAARMADERAARLADIADAAPLERGEVDEGFNAP